MNKKNFKVGDEVFHTGHSLKRGKIIKILDYGYTVQTKHGEEFFSDSSTYTKEDAYRECEDNADYWQREAARLLKELEAEDEQEDSTDEFESKYLESYENYVAA